MDVVVVVVILTSPAIDLNRVQTSKWKIRKRLKGGKPILTVAPWSLWIRVVVVVLDDVGIIEKVRSFPFAADAMMEWMCRSGEQGRENRNKFS